MSEVAANPAAEVCWYFPTTREQYRISGELQVVAEGEANQTLSEVGMR